MKKNIFNKKTGSAVAISLVISTALLLLALSYSKITQTASKPTYTIDEHTRLQYLADGLARIALLKFQKFPTDFYAAWESKDDEKIKAFGPKAPEFDFDLDKYVGDQSDSYLSTGKIKIGIASMSLRTNLEAKWDTDVVTVVSYAEYKAKNGNSMQASCTMSVIAERNDTKL